MYNIYMYTNIFIYIHTYIHIHKRSINVIVRLPNPRSGDNQD